jgi:hypothetical protein
MKDLASVNAPLAILKERYLLLELLGEGGSGKTYRALDMNGRQKS